MHLLTCTNFLGPAATVLSYDPSKVIEDATKTCAVGHHHIFDPLNVFFLMLCRLGLGLPEQDLAFRFQISQPTVSRIFNTCINFLFVIFSKVPLWPNQQTIDKYMPASFRALYPTTRCIIDATEIFMQMLSNPTAQQLTFSSYKNHNTLKAVVGICCQE